MEDLTLRGNDKVLDLVPSIAENRTRDTNDL